MGGHPENKDQPTRNRNQPHAWTTPRTEETTKYKKGRQHGIAHVPHSPDSSLSSSFSKAPQHRTTGAWGRPHMAWTAESAHASSCCSCSVVCWFEGRGHRMAVIVCCTCMDVIRIKPYATCTLICHCHCHCCAGERLSGCENRRGGNASCLLLVSSG